MNDPVVAELATDESSSVALVDANAQWSRRELARAVRKVAAGLLREGVRPGHRVAVVTQPDVVSVAGLLGARAVGALVCPIDAHVAPSLAPRLSATVVSEQAVDGVRTLRPSRLLETSDEIDLLADRSCEGTAWGVCTSGTSGSPNVVTMIGSGIASILDVVAPIVGYREDDVVMSPLPLHHIYGLSQIWFSLRARATLVLAPPGMRLAEFGESVKTATVLAGVPHTVRTILRFGPFPRLRLVTLSGQTTVFEERNAFTQALPTTEFLQFYGLTEGFRVLWLPAHEFAAGEATGRPIPGMRAWLEDGELWVEGPNVATGYLDSPAATAKRFPRPGCLRTGDLFEQRDGLFRYLGRSDGVFKSLGEKVLPEVIERAILAHPKVERCLVAGERIADGREHRPVAWIVLRDSSLTRGELVAHLRQRLPAVMVPVRITVVDALPTTPTGKVVRMRPALGSNGGDKRPL